jgi:hypothetical protein
MKAKICQSCAMPLRNGSDFGTNEDKSKSEEYCLHCFKNGRFIDEGVSLRKKKDKNVGLAVKMGWDETEARETANQILPTLKRWKRYKI